MNAQYSMEIHNKIMFHHCLFCFLPFKPFIFVLLFLGTICSESESEELTKWLTSYVYFFYP